MDYGFTHEGKVYTPNGTPDVSVTDNDTRNKAIERAELEHWQTQPDRMLGYYNVQTGQVSTWLGTSIGRILHYSIVRHNFGGQFIILRMRGTNGAEYYGRASYDWGTCINLRKAKRK